MGVIKYMSVLTTCSIFAAFISIVWQAFLSLKQLNKVTTVLTGLLAIERSLRHPSNTGAPVQRPRVAIGYGACTDLLISATEFLNFTEAYVRDIGPEFTVDEVNDERELLQTFAYYFKNGAAAERIMPNSTLFRQLVATAKSLHKDSIRWFIGGNAPLMGTRFFTEGADVLLGARMSHKLRRLIPEEIKLAGDLIDEDDIHIILEYKAGDTWGPFTAPRANRYILHNDQNNPHLNSVEHFDAALRDFAPRLLVVSGLQMMDSYKFAPGVRKARLLKVKQQLATQSPLETLQHFEMASYVEIELLQQLREYILPYVDSLGMNEQELDNLRQVLEHGRVTLASDSNPRVASTLDQMRAVFKFLAKDYNKSKHKDEKRRLLSRIHVHTLAYQAVLTLKDSQWRNSNVAAAKSALTAHRYVCQTDAVNPELAALVLDDSFATTAQAASQRMEIKPHHPVPCWDESIVVEGLERTLEVEICVAPVLVCRVAKKTAGAGDNISAAALSQQI